MNRETPGSFPEPNSRIDKEEKELKKVYEEHEKKVNEEIGKPTEEPKETVFGQLEADENIESTLKEASEAQQKIDIFGDLTEDEIDKALSSLEEEPIEVTDEMILEERIEVTDEMILDEEEPIEVTDDMIIAEKEMKGEKSEWKDRPNFMDDLRQAALERQERLKSLGKTEASEEIENFIKDHEAETAKKEAKRAHDLREAALEKLEKLESLVNKKDAETLLNKNELSEASKIQAEAERKGLLKEYKKGQAEIVALENRIKQLYGVDPETKAVSGLQKLKYNLKSVLSPSLRRTWKRYESVIQSTVKAKEDADLLKMMIDDPKGYTNYLASRHEQITGLRNKAMQTPKKQPGIYRIYI